MTAPKEPRGGPCEYDQQWLAGAMLLLGERLRDWRTRKGWSQARAADWYGVDVRTWRRWERAETPIPLHVWKRVSP